MLFQYRPTWTNIETTSGQILVFAGRAVGVLKRVGRLCLVGTGCDH